MLHAIRQVEHSRQDFTSRSGAKGVYQITPAVWYRHSTKPHSMATSANPIAVRETAHVARAHLRAIRLELRAAGYPETPYFCALAWKAGVEGAKAKRVPREDISYAERAANLYEDKP
ncbi:MAG TPA: hypothetical protein VEC57_00165 [Candidatus Limnocylindrales bacterium]|nr:hypothetical protein [Candidatus Limnocylindrales bacterium]